MFSSTEDYHRCDHLANTPLPKDYPLAQQAAVSSSLATYGVHRCPSAAHMPIPLERVLGKFASQPAGSQHISTFICNLIYAQILKLQVTNQFRQVAYSVLEMCLTRTTDNQAEFADTGRSKIAHILWNPTTFGNC